MRRLITIALAGCLTLALTGIERAAADLSAARPGAPAAAGTVELATGTIDWGRCDDGFLRSRGAECGFVRVPLSYARPRGATLRLAVARVRHTSPDSAYQGVMLTNPGGPGGPGLEYATVGRDMPRGSGAYYDWIGIDPRGVARSRPRLSCDPRYFHGDRPPYVPHSRRVERRWLVRSDQYARACAARHPRLLAHMTTRDIVRDLDRVRTALGVRRINYYGWSYGAQLGQAYATMFPERVRRMVLDANPDPSEPPYRGYGSLQNDAFEVVVDAWFDWIARRHGTYRLGETAGAVERRFYRQEQRLRRHPARGVLGPSEWRDAFTIVGYTDLAWQQQADAFAAWVHRRDPRPVLDAWRFFDTPGDDNFYGVYLAVACTDDRWPRRWARWRRDARAQHRTAPFLTWNNTWFNAPCRTWRADPGRPVRVDGHEVRALLFTQTRDAATPFSGSLEVRQRFPRARLVAVDGGYAHGGTPYLGGPCVRAPLADYLARGELPARVPGMVPDVTCPAPPLPE